MSDTADITVGPAVQAGDKSSVKADPECFTRFEVGITGRPVKGVFGLGKMDGIDGRSISVGFDDAFQFVQRRHQPVLIPTQLKVQAIISCSIPFS